MGLKSHGIFVPGRKSRDFGLGLGLILLGRLGLGQISLELRSIFMFFQKIQKSRDCPWDSSTNQSQEFWLSQSRPMGHKSLGLLGLGQIVGTVPGF